MYAADRQTSDVRRASSLNFSALWGRVIIIQVQPAVSRSFKDSHGEENFGVETAPQPNGTNSEESWIPLQSADLLLMLLQWYMLISSR